MMTNALDDAYRAAHEAQIKDHPEGGKYIDTNVDVAIGAFLAHLADNPPEEIRQALADPGRFTKRQNATNLEPLYLWQARALMVALRSIVEVKA